MKKAYCLYSNNHTVTDYYMDIIKLAFVKVGYDVEELLTTTKVIDKQSPLIVNSLMAFFRCYVRGYKNIVMWSQGIVPEESYMRNHSKWRFWLLSALEKWALKHAKMNLFVSETQKVFYMNKYGIELDKNSYIMPCYNCELVEDSFYTPQKYQKNIFCFAGSCVAVWQYFDATLDFYKKIEKKYGDKVSLKILSPNKDEALKKIKDKQIRYYSIEYVSSEQLPERLADCKFGLLLREDCAVNNVATPTKLSTYMSCGLIPVVSMCIKDFEKRMRGDRNFALINNELDPDNVVELIENPPLAEDVLASYKHYWDLNYNTERHIDNIAALISNVFNG